MMIFNWRIVYIVDAGWRLGMDMLLLLEVW